MRGRLVRLLAAAALAAAATVVGPLGTPPAQAAGCAGATGVTVVVDFHQLGGGVRQACDADGGGKKASVVFPDSGFPLTYVQRQPGFVCRVSGAPSSDPCVNTPPATAYWSLWWSDGTSGTWTYASVGVGSLEVPSGGYVAFSWQGQDGKAPPGVTPAPRTAKPSSSPTTSGGGNDGGGGTGGGGGRGGASTAPTSPSAAPEPSPSERSASERKARRKARATASATPSGDASASPTGESTDSPPSGGSATTDDRAEGDDERARVPAWLGVLTVGGLLTAAAAVAAIRSRRGGA